MTAASPAGSRSAPGHSACTRSGRPSAASTGMTSRDRFSLTCGNSSTPDGQRKHLKPSTPAARERLEMIHIARHHAAPESPRPHDTRARRRGASSSSASTVVVGGNAVERHVHDRRDAACRGRSRRVHETFPVGAAGLVDVHVGIDETGQDHQVARVDDATDDVWRVCAVSDCRDPPVADLDVHRTARRPAGRLAGCEGWSCCLGPIQRAIVASISPYGSSVGTKTSLRFARPKRDRSTGK